MGTINIKPELKEIKVKGKTAVYRLYSRGKLNKFNPVVLGLGDISAKSKQIEAIAAVYDLSGFTNFCRQVDPHLSVPTYLHEFLNWLFENIKIQAISKRYRRGILLNAKLPFFAKFMGDGVLFLWDATDMKNTMMCNIVIGNRNICTKYSSNFVPEIKKHLTDIPTSLRCGVARGMVYSVGNGEDYVGPCINIASRLQKLSKLPFCFSRRGLDFEKGMLEETARAINIKEQDFSNIEKNAEDKFMKDIKGYCSHPKYENLREYLKIITSKKTKINCLILFGEQGIGKSQAIKNQMLELKKDFLYLNSYSTSLSFYKLVYQNRFKHIIIDDCVGIDDEKGIGILRALCNTENVRYIKYDSTSEKLEDVPSSFIFEGSITILTNKIRNEMDNSLLSRAIKREIKFTLKEKLDFMEQIAIFHYPKLTQKGLKEIMDFIKNSVDETNTNFSFRSVLKIIEFYNMSKNRWKILSDEELEKSDELIFVKSIFLLPTDERNKKWIEETGRTIRTLQRKIKEMGLNDKTTRKIKNAYTGKKGVKNRDGKPKIKTNP